MHHDESKDQAKERRSIIESYYRHRSNSRPVDVETYTDCHGFLHKTIEDSLRVTSCQTKSSFPGFEKLHLEKGNRRLQKLVKYGVPDGLRSSLWKSLLSVEATKASKRGIYRKILIEALRRSPHVRQIHLDIQRTFRDHISFSEEFGLKQVELLNVLLAYSLYNPEVGYCQGMSEVAAILLMFMAEEQAFWGFERLFSNPLYNLHGIFTLNFPRLFSLQEHHDHLLRLYSRSLHKHLVKKCEISAPLYTFRWFMQCFVGKIPFSATLRLYDMFFLEGDCVLTVMSFVVMRMLRRSIKGLEFEGVMKLLNKSPLLPDDMMDKLFRKYKKYKKIFEREKCHHAPATEQTWPTEPIILTDPRRYAMEISLNQPRETTFDNIVADGVRNIKAKKSDSTDLDDVESFLSDDSLESIESTVTSASVRTTHYFGLKIKKGRQDEKVIKQTIL